MATITERKLNLNQSVETELRKDFFSLVRIWLRNYRTRKTLSELPDHLLNDIGKTSEQALNEASKPFWR